jgi:hypothetical protein
MDHEMQLGQHVIYVDSYRKEHDALLTAVHGDPRGRQILWRNEAGEPNGTGRVLTYLEGTEGQQWPCVNLVIVRDGDAKDQYGQQIEHFSSIVHWRQSSARASCFRFVGETMAPPA